MTNFFKTMFCKPTPERFAITQLADARLQLLAAYNAKEYAVAAIQHRESQVARLAKFLNQTAE